MESIIDDLKRIVSDLEYGDITKNQVVDRIELAINEINDLENNN